jgi:hypothetical protein
MRVSSSIAFNAAALYVTMRGSMHWKLEDYSISDETLKCF